MWGQTISLLALCNHFHVGLTAVAVPTRSAWSSRMLGSLPRPPATSRCQIRHPLSTYLNFKSTNNNDHSTTPALHSCLNQSHWPIVVGVLLSAYYAVHYLHVMD